MAREAGLCDSRQTRVDRKHGLCREIGFGHAPDSILSAVKSSRTMHGAQFQQIARTIRDDPELITTIMEGHTDWIGTDEYNQGLSERRANAVKQKPVEDYGIATARIEFQGFGESRPVADNTTATGRRQSRRAIAAILRTRPVTE